MPNATTEALSVIADSIVALAAIVAATASFVGVQMWRSQLVGTGAYELARRLLRETYAVRDEIRVLRSFFLSAREIADAVKKLELDVPLHSHEAVRATYAIRWRRLADVYRRFTVESLESEVMWADDAKNATAGLMECVRLLSVHLDLFLQDRSAHRESARFVERTIEEASDEYWQSVLSSVKSIEALARKHIPKS